MKINISYIYDNIYNKNKKEEIKPCGCRTIERPTQMDFLSWRYFIEEEAAKTEMKNVVIRNNLGNREKFIRNLVKTIVEANIL